MSTTDDPESAGGTGATRPAVEPTADAPTTEGAPADDASAPEGAPAADASATEGGPVAAAPPSAEELARTATPATLRRAPRYRGFAYAGVLVGFVAAGVAVAVSGPARDGAPLNTVSVLLLLAVILGGFGALLGAGVAVLVDRRSLRASRRAAPESPPAA